MFEIKSSKSKVKTGFGQQQTKRNNTMLLFNLIRKNGQLPRIKLAELTGLSATTVSMLIEDLIGNNLVKEMGAVDLNTRGRRPIMLEVNGEGGYFVVVEIINTGIICHLYDLGLKHIDFLQYRIDGSIQKNAASVYIRQLLANWNIDPVSLLGINVIYPGIVDRVAKKVIYSAVVPMRDLLGDDEVELMQEEYPNADVMISNYSSVSAYSEYMFNDYNYSRSLVAVNIFEAVGAAAIFMNEKGEKTVDFSIEFGHLMMDQNGPVCKCGNRGCMEALVGIVAIFKKVEQETGISLDFCDEFNSSRNICAIKKVKEEADKGNEAVIRILDETANWIALGLTNMNNIIDPGYIFISGTIKYLGEEFLDRIKVKRPSIFRLNSVI